MRQEKLFPATAMPNRDWWAALWPAPERVLQQLGIEPGMTALDLCCGDGYFTAPLARLLEGRVYAIDIDPAMIEQARAECAQQGGAVRQWICGDARDVARLIPEPVDFVLIANTFHGVPDKTGLAKAVRQVLTAEGRLAVVNWHRIPREQTVVEGAPRGPRTAMRQSPDDVREVIEPAGFELVQVVELPPYHYGAIFKKARENG